MAFLRRTRLKTKDERLKTDTFEGTLDDLCAQYELYRNLTDMAGRITSDTPIDTILQSILDQLNELCGSEKSLILIFNRDGELVFEKGRNLSKTDIEAPGFEVSWSIINAVKTDLQAVCLKNALQDDAVNSKSVLRLKLLSVICVPILFNDRLVGVFYADNRHVDGIFDDADFKLVQQTMQFLAGQLYTLLTTIELRHNLNRLQQQIEYNTKHPDIIGNSPKLRHVLGLVDQVADTAATVLIEGASGTGKELIARALHHNSRRADNRFVSLNCGALPDSLLESELFGHVKGAFTGAVRDKKGWFEAADGGTIFFDEISDMSPALQVKLLRILQTGEFSPLGSEQIKKCDVRVVAATNISLKTLVDQQKFRADLYYRLNIINLQLPLLKERVDDILMLAMFFIKKYEKTVNKTDLTFDRDAQQLLLNYDFPGNVRELENAVQRAVLLCNGKNITVHDLPESMRSLPLPRNSGTGTFAQEKNRLVESFEKEYITNALQKYNGVVAKAARFAGMDAKNFYQKMEKYGISAAQFKKG